MYPADNTQPGSTQDPALFNGALPEGALPIVEIEDEILPIVDVESEQPLTPFYETAPQRIARQPQHGANWGGTPMSAEEEIARLGLGAFRADDTKDLSPSARWLGDLAGGKLSSSAAELAGYDENTMVGKAAAVADAVSPLNYMFPDEFMWDIHKRFPSAALDMASRISQAGQTLSQAAAEEGMPDLSQVDTPGQVIRKINEITQDRLQADSDRKWGGKSAVEKLTGPRGLEWLTESVADQVPGLALTMLNPAAGASAYAAGGFGEASQRALERGASMEEAIASGAAVGVTEGLGEYLMGKLYKGGLKGLGFSGNLPGGAASATAAAIAGEAATENIQEFAGQEMVRGGGAISEAIRTGNWEPVWDQALETAIIAAPIGGGLGGHAAMGEANQKKRQEQFKRDLRAWMGEAEISGESFSQAALTDEFLKAYLQGSPEAAKKIMALQGTPSRKFWKENAVGLQRATNSTEYRRTFQERLRQVFLDQALDPSPEFEGLEGVKEQPPGPRTAIFQDELSQHLQGQVDNRQFEKDILEAQEALRNWKPEPKYQEPAKESVQPEAKTPPASTTAPPEPQKSPQPVPEPAEAPEPPEASQGPSEGDTKIDGFQEDEDIRAYDAEAGAWIEGKLATRDEDGWWIQPEGTTDPDDQIWYETRTITRKPKDPQPQTKPAKLTAKKKPAATKGQQEEVQPQPEVEGREGAAESSPQEGSRVGDIPDDYYDDPEAYDWKRMIPERGFKGSREVPPQTVEEILHFLNPSGKAKSANPGHAVASIALLEAGVNSDKVFEAINRINTVGQLAGRFGVKKKPMEVTQEDIDRVQAAIEEESKPKKKEKFDGKAKKPSPPVKAEGEVVDWTEVIASNWKEKVTKGRLVEEYKKLTGKDDGNDRKPGKLVEIIRTEFHPERMNASEKKAQQEKTEPVTRGVSEEVSAQEKAEKRSALYNQTIESLDAMDRVRLKELIKDINDLGGDVKAKRSNKDTAREVMKGIESLKKADSKLKAKQSKPAKQEAKPEKPKQKPKKLESKWVDSESGHSKIRKSAGHGKGDHKMWDVKMPDGTVHQIERTTGINLKPAWFVQNAGNDTVMGQEFPIGDNKAEAVKWLEERFFDDVQRKREAELREDMEAGKKEPDPKKAPRAGEISEEQMEDTLNEVVSFSEGLIREGKSSLEREAYIIQNNMRVYVDSYGLEAERVKSAIEDLKRRIGDFVYTPRKASPAGDRKLRDRPEGRKPTAYLHDNGPDDSYVQLPDDSIVELTWERRQNEEDNPMVIKVYSYKNKPIEGRKQITHTDIEYYKDNAHKNLISRVTSDWHNNRLAEQQQPGTSLGSVLESAADFEESAEADVPEKSTPIKGGKYQPTKGVDDNLEVEEMTFNKPRYHPEYKPGTATKEQKKRALSRFTIAAHAEYDFGTPFRNRFIPKGAGVFRIYAETIHMSKQYANNLATVYHELGHKLDKDHGITGQIFQATAVNDDKYINPDIPQDVVDELKPLDYDTNGRDWLAEGFAEFFRMYVTRPGQASVEAPKAVKWFDALLDKNPELKEKVLKHRQMVADNAALPTADRNNLDNNPKRRFFGLGKPVMRRGTADSPVKMAKKWLAEKHIDRFNPIRRMENLIKKKGGPENDVYDKAMVYPGMGNTLAEDAVMHGLEWMDGTRYQEKGLLQIWNSIDPHLHEDFQAYARASHLLGDVFTSKTRKIPKKELKKFHGMTKQEAINIQNEMHAKHDASVIASFEEAHRDLTEYHNGLLRFAVERGLATDMDEWNMQTKMRNYVPNFTKDARDLVNIQQRGGANLIKTHDPFKNRKGGDELPRMDILEASILKTQMVIDAALKRDIQQSLYDMAMSAPPGTDISEFFEISTEAPTGLSTESELMSTDSIDGVAKDIMLPLVGYKEDQRVIKVKDSNGNAVYMLLKDDMARAINGTEKTMNGRLAYWLNKNAAFTKSIYTVNLPFIVRNAFRDAVTYGFKSKYTSLSPFELFTDPNNNTVVAFMRELGLGFAKQFGKLKDDEFTRLFDLMGGNLHNRLQHSRGSVEDLSRHVRTNLGGIQGIKSAVRNIQDAKDAATFSRDAYATAWDTLKRVGDITESAARRAEARGYLKSRGYTFKDGKILKNGVPTHPTQQEVLGMARAAQEATVNFSRGGTFAKEFNKISIFYNASVQGSLAVWDGLNAVAGRSDSEQQIANARWAAASMAGLSFLYHLLSHDEDEYITQNDYERDNFWTFWAGNYRVRIPIPYGFAAINDTARVAVDVLKGEDPELLKSITNRLNNDLLPVSMPLDDEGFALTDALASTGVPLFDASVEVIANRDAFRNRPIVPDHLQDLEARAQYDENMKSFWDAPVSWTIHEATGKAVPPLLARHFMDSITGDPFDRMGVPRGGPLELTGIIRKGESNRDVGDYYSELNKLERKVSTEVRVGEISESKESNSYEKLRKLDSYRKIIGSLYAQIREETDEKEQAFLRKVLVGTAREALGRPRLDRYPGISDPRSAGTLKVDKEDFRSLVNRIWDNRSKKKYGKLDVDTGMIKALGPAELNRLSREWERWARAKRKSDGSKYLSDESINKRLAELKKMSSRARMRRQ